MYLQASLPLLHKLDHFENAPLQREEIPSSTLDQFLYRSIFHLSILSFIPQIQFSSKREYIANVLYFNEKKNSRIELEPMALKLGVCCSTD